MKNYYTAVTLALLPPALAYAAPKVMDYQGLPAWAGGFKIRTMHWRRGA